MPNHFFFSFPTPFFRLTLLLKTGPDERYASYYVERRRRRKKKLSITESIRKKKYITVRCMIYVLGVRLDGEPFLLKRKTLATCSLFPKFYFVGGEFSGGWKTFLEQPLEFRLESVCGATCNLFEKKCLSSSKLSSRGLELGEVIYQLNGPIIRPAYDIAHRSCGETPHPLQIKHRSIPKTFSRRHRRGSIPILIKPSPILGIQSIPNRRRRCC